MDPPELRLETALNLLHLAAQTDLATRGAEALRYVHAAETVLPDMPVDLRIRAALLRARVAGAANQLDDAAKWAEDAVSMARRHRLPHGLGMALALRGEVDVRRHAYKAALPLLEQGTSLMRRARAARTEENVRALTSLGTTYLQLGRIDAARRTYRRVQGLATRLGLDALNAKALSGLGLVEWLRRRFDVAADYLAEARDAFERVEDLPEMSRVLTNLGIVRREQGRYQDALKVLDQAIRIKERLNDGGGRSAALDETAQVLLAMGRTSEAARAARRAIREAQASGDRMREAEAQVTLGRILRARGLDRDGIAMLRGALENFKRLRLSGRVAALSAEISPLTGAGAQTEATRQVKLARHPSLHSKERSVEAAPLPLL